MASRLVEGINNHEKLSKFTYNKYEKRSPVSQLRAMYNIEPTQPFLSVQIDSGKLNLLQKREGVSTSLGSYHRTTKPRMSSRQNIQRNKSAPVWIKVPTHDEMWESCALSEVPKQRRVVFSPLKSISRPQTTPAPNQTKQSNAAQNRLKLTRSAVQNKSSKSATLYRLKNVDRGNKSALKAANTPANTPAVSPSRDSIQLYTALIKEQWDSRQRQYLKSGVYARGQSEAKDKELMQWFTFEGSSPGALHAFTKDTEPERLSTPAQFSIEANVGKEVAAKLVLGGFVRIGKNGKLLPSDLLDDQDFDTDFYEKCDEVLEMTRLASNKHEPIYPPLCWRDVEKEARVLLSTDRSKPDEEPLNKSTPIVYNKEPKIKPYVPSDAQSNEEILNDLLRQSHPRKSNPVEITMTYDEVLESRAPDSTRQEKHCSKKPVPSPEMPRSSGRESTSVFLPKTPKGHSSKPGNRDTQESRLLMRTPCIPDEVKSGIHRQVTMPSYKIIPGRSEKVAGRPNASADPYERVATPARPPKYTPSYNSGHHTSTSISSHGVEGDKYFVKFNTPINQLVHSNGSHSPLTSPRVKNSNNNAIERANTEPLPHANTAQTDITNVTLVGKTPAFERIVRTTHSGRKGGAYPASNTGLSGSEITSSAVENKTEPMSATTPHLHTSRLNINIPAVDMISASSAAVNSIDDFYDDDIERRHNVTRSTERSESRALSLPASCHSAKRPPSIASLEEDPSKYDISVEIVELKKVVEV